MALARVGVHTGTNTTFASSVTTASWTSTTGNLLIAVVEADTVAQNGITVTDSKSNTWSRLISTSLAATFDLEIWYTVLTTGGASHTVTATDNGGGVDSLIIVEEWSGSATSPADKSAGATGTVSTALNSGSSGVLAQAAELIICAGVASGNVTMTAGGSFTNLNKVNTVFSTLAFASQVVASTSAVTGTMTSGTIGSWVCQVGTFKELVTASNIRNLALLGVG
jgi:hypothetical protein